MFERFLLTYPPTPLPGTTYHLHPPIPDESVRGFTELMNAYPGATFGNGVYRLHTETSGKRATSLVQRAFANAGNAYAFAYDWLGRQFLLDPSNRADSEPGVVLIDLVEQHWYVCDQTFHDFHEVMLIEKPDLVLDSELFGEWAALHPEALPLRPNQIVGYRIPLQLGGEHTLDNFEVVDFEVELDFSAQIEEQIEDLPDGTVITNVTIQNGGTTTKAT